MILKPEWLVAAGASTQSSELWLTPIGDAMSEFSIDSEKRAAAFLAQIGHESDGFKYVVENLNYSHERLMEIFPKYFPSIDIAFSYERNPFRIGSRVYANRLGNGDEGTADGYRYRGRGLIQITGKENYAKVGQRLHIDLVGRPALLENPVYASRSAGAFWADHGLNELADNDQFQIITQRINGGLNGYEDRIARWKSVKKSIAFALIEL